MYLGDGGTLGTLYLLSSLLECPQHPSSITITLEGGAIRIQAACVPPLVLPRAPGQLPYFVEICTQVDVAIDAPASIAPLEIFDTDAEVPSFTRLSIAPPYLMIANALSEYFVIASVSHGVATTARFERGVLRSSPFAEPVAQADGLSILFKLDQLASYGDHGSLGPFGRFDLVAELARASANVRRVPITVIYRSARAERRFTATPGTGEAGAAPGVALTYASAHDFVRNYSARGGDPPPYDVNGVIHLMLAALDNLRAHRIDGDLEQIALAATREQRACLIEIGEFLRANPEAAGDDDAG